MAELAEELLHFIEESPVSFFAVRSITEGLKAAGFKELDEACEWNIKLGGCYYVVRNQSSVIAFRVPKIQYKGIMIAAAHSDSPAFRIKPNAEKESDNGYVLLDTECYGGMIMPTWFDIPLSAAGRVMRETKNGIRSELVNINKNSMIIPSLAIHMKRDEDKNRKYNPQKELLPVYGTEKSLGGFYEDIGRNIGFDMYLYNRMKGTVWGKQNEMFSAPRIDDLECAFCIAKAFTESDFTDALQLMAVFDNEEVGSSTRQGAKSDFLSETLERINLSLNISKERFLAAKASGLMLSADNAHAYHPNYSERACPSNRPVINGGVVIKHNANRRYTTDAVSEALFRKICDNANVPYQFFTNRSDMPGGSTLGNLSNEKVSLNTIDIGLAQLAMHSSYETAGTKDILYMLEAVKAFYGSVIAVSGNEYFIKE